MSLGKKIIAGALVALVLLAVAGLVGVFVVAPGVAQKLVREKLDSAERRLGVEIETSSIETAGLRGVEITDLVIKDPESGRTLATIGEVGATLAVGKLLTGDRVINKVWTRRVVVNITREDDGQFDLIRVAKRARSNGGEAVEEVEEETGEGSRGGGILRLFGGTLPEVEVTDVQVLFTGTPNAPAFPLKSLTVPTGEIEHTDGIEVRTQVAVESNPSPSWTIPTSVDLTAMLTDELEPVAINVKFDRPLEVGGVEPYPFVRGGFASIEMAENRALTINDFHMGFQSNGKEKPFLTTKRIGVTVDKWALNPDDLKLAAVDVDTPVLNLTYDRFGASALEDLDHALRGPRARQVAANARRFAEKIAEKKKPAQEPEDEDDEDTEDAAPEEEEPAEVDMAPGRMALLAARLPQRITVTNASAIVVDDRDLPVARRARTLRMENGNFEVEHRPSESTFGLVAAFRALADEQPRGEVKSNISVQYVEKKVDGDVEIDALDLSWLGQILGPRVAEHVRGGTLRAKIGVKQGSGRAVTIDGTASVENLVFYHRLLTEEPLEDVTASYTFAASYDPTASIPAARLLKTELFKEGRTPPPGDGVFKGALVFQKGQAQVRDVKATFAPAVYGTGALPRGLPARFDLRIDLPTTAVQDIFDAVPVAVQGPLAGTKLAGSLAWKLDLEVPLHRAGDMMWVSTPVLEEFEILEMPADMHPEKLMKGFRLTITDTLEDKKGEEYEWTRTVTIPPAKPIPARYLVENGGIEIETLDARRRKREWPPVPDAGRSFLPRVTLESPQYWYTTHAENQAARRPWSDGDEIQPTERQPYGPYVFVPLQYIAPWVVRTVTTTEDGGFFRHPGFLFDALKESVEDNIEASGFRRGASTISMQLVKNAFLDRQKLIARKVREAFLVFLMESVVDVPKARILEVYLNIIEFGPGIYGIHDASVHYFGKRPDELEINEVAWLFSIVPAPKKYHFYFDRGEITDRWFAKMNRYIDAMYRRDKITEMERDAAVAAAPQFYKPEEGEPVLRPKAPMFPGGSLLFDDAFTTPPPTGDTPPSNPNPLFQRPQQQPAQTPPQTPPPKERKGIRGWFD